MIGVVLAREALELPTGLGRALVGLGCAVASALVLAYGWALHHADDRDGDPSGPLELQVVLSRVIGGVLLVAAVVLVVQGFLGGD